VEVEECRKEQPFLITLPVPLEDGESAVTSAEVSQVGATVEESLDTGDNLEVPYTDTHSPMDTTPAQTRG